VIEVARVSSYFPVVFMYTDLLWEAEKLKSGSPFFLTDDDRHGPSLSRIWITSVREVRSGLDPVDKDERKFVATGKVLASSPVVAKKSSVEWTHVFG
jgi:hypothetical protein